MEKIVVILGNVNGEWKKSHLGAINIGLQFSKTTETPLEIVAYGTLPKENIKGIESIVLNPENINFEQYQQIGYEYAKENTLLIFPTNSQTKTFAPYIAGKKSINYLSQVSEIIKNSNNNICIARNVNNNKARQWIRFDGKTAILLATSPLAISNLEMDTTDIKIVEEEVSKVKNDFCTNKKLPKIDTEKSNTLHSLADAHIILSGGRGMKSSENWHLIEDLAKKLNAALACSKPVSDNDWRPHSEHVGQTGKVVSPHIYIAVGISGAIQHVAGIQSSRYIFAINNDPEAPIFKVSDVGIVGDALSILPALKDLL